MTLHHYLSLGPQKIPILTVFLCGRRSILRLLAYPATWPETMFWDLHRYYRRRILYHGMIWYNMIYHDEIITWIHCMISSREFITWNHYVNSLHVIIKWIHYMKLLCEFITWNHYVNSLHIIIKWIHFMKSLREFITLIQQIKSLREWITWNHYENSLHEIWCNQFTTQAAIKTSNVTDLGTQLCLNTQTRGRIFLFSTVHLCRGHSIFFAGHYMKLVCEFITRNQYMNSLHEIITWIHYIQSLREFITQIQ